MFPSRFVVGMVEHVHGAGCCDSFEVIPQLSPVPVAGGASQENDESSQFGFTGEGPELEPTFPLVWEVADVDGHKDQIRLGCIECGGRLIPFIKHRFQVDSANLAKFDAIDILFEEKELFPSPSRKGGVIVNDCGVQLELRLRIVRIRLDLAGAGHSSVLDSSG